MADDISCTVIDALAENRKQKILASRTEIKCEGRAYFVSNNGADDNDGLIEKHPLKP